MLHHRCGSNCRKVRMTRHTHPRGRHDFMYTGNVRSVNTKRMQTLLNSAQPGVPLPVIQKGTRVLISLWADTWADPWHPPGH